MTAETAQHGRVLRAYDRAKQGEALAPDEVALLFHWLWRWREVAGELAHALDGTASSHATAELALNSYLVVARQWSQACGTGPVTVADLHDGADR